jgi:intracellular multiplication protein IcmK
MNFRRFIYSIFCAAYLLFGHIYAAQAQDEGFGDFIPAPMDEGLLDTDEEQVFEKTPEEIEEELRKEAFDASVEGILPLRPGEIRELLRRFDETQKAVEKPVNTPPEPKVVVETVSIDPGTQPTVVKVSHGYVTTINFVDQTGAPWPIEDMTWAGDFEVIDNNQNEASHFVRIAPQSTFAYGNISIHMLSLQTPIILTLESDPAEVYYRFDAIVPEAGPMAKVPLIESGMTTVAGDVSMTNILEGVVPANATRLNVSGVDGRTTAYKFNGMTYLRTPMNLLSPAWVSSARSADGMRVYALNSAPVILLSNKGKMVRARLSERATNPLESITQ